jgi:hypothetical protein
MTKTSKTDQRIRAAQPTIRTCGEQEELKVGIRAAAPEVEGGGPTAAEIYQAGKYAATRGEDATPRTPLRDLVKRWRQIARNAREAADAAIENDDQPFEGLIAREIAMYQASDELDAALRAATPQPRKHLTGSELQSICYEKCGLNPAWMLSRWQKLADAICEKLATTQGED